MGAFPGTSVHTADNAVPPLDDDFEDALEDLSGIHAGIDLIRAGIRTIALDRLDRDRTQTILAALGGHSGGIDVLGLIGATIARLADADTNPCLRDLDPATVDNLRRIGGGYATDLATTAPRDLAAELSGHIDPYFHPDGTAASR